MRREKILRLGVLGILLAAGSSSTGCSSMNNTEKGAGIGGALGAGVGLAAGAATGNPRTGALVGGALGAGTGALIGNDVDRQEKRDRDFQQAVATAQVQAQQQRLGVFDVIRLSQSGLEDQLIINQIRSTGSTFQLTASDLGELKANGVSASVISEMQVARASGPLMTRVAQPTTVIYEQPYPPSAVIVAPRPYYYPRPRPVVFVGGSYCR